VILRNIQRSDLNLLAANRKIPILGAPPVTITYTRARTRDVYRKSVDELFLMLNTLEGPQAATDRARLSTLRPKEKYLALTKAHYDNILTCLAFAVDCLYCCHLVRSSCHCSTWLFQCAYNVLQDLILELDRGEFSARGLGLSVNGAHNLH
jgi:hypothetical protein